MKKIVSPITGKSKYLLIENCEFISDVKISNDLKESLKLSNGKAGTLIVKNLPGTILNRENQNGRIYSTQVLLEAIREAKPLLETKQLLSQACEHPEGSFVSPTTASHVVTNAYIKKNVSVTVDGETGTYDMLFMDIEVLNTDEGRNLRALLEAECSVGTSIRGVGDMEGKYVKNYEILGIDFVGNPSSSTFTRMPVSESVKVEVKDPREMKETFTVTTTSTNVTRDLEQAALLQQQLEAIGYGTVTKTSTKLDQETDPKTGAQTSITTLEAETSDDVSDLDQALQMAKNAMLNGTVNVDSVTIENIPEEGETKEAVESEYVPEKTTLAEQPVTEAKKEDEEDPNLGKKFVLHTDRGFVTFDKNAIDFTQNPEDALHFTEGKEENGMVSMSKVTEILDAMGIFEVEKYFQKSDINLGATSDENDGLTNEEPKEEQASINASLSEENGSNTKYIAQVTIQGANGTTNETIPVSSVDIESAKNEIGNLWDMKIKSVEGNGSVNIILTDTTTGEQLHYNPETKLLESELAEEDKGFENPVVCAWCKDTYEQDDCKKEKDLGWLCDQCQRSLESQGVPLEFENTSITETNDGITIEDDKVISKFDDGTTIEKEFDSPLEAKVAVAAVDKDEADPELLVSEEVKPSREGFEKLVKAVMASCNISDPEEAWDEILGSRRTFEENITSDPDRASEYLQWALDDLGLELDYTLEFLDVPCSEIKAEPVDEKLYSNPSEPSDNYEKEPLEDAITEDFIVVLGDIDWDITNVDPNFLSKIENLPDTIDIRIQGTTIDTADSPEDLKAAILAGANETMNPFGIKDGTVISIKDTKTGEKLM